MILGFIFITTNGHALGNAQPTLGETEHLARFERSGWFYALERDDISGNTFLRRVHSKGD